MPEPDPYKGVSGSLAPREGGVPPGSASVSAGTHRKVVSDRLGHASIAITLDTYSHVIAGVGEEAANHVAALTLGTAK